MDNICENIIRFFHNQYYIEKQYNKKERYKCFTFYKKYEKWCDDNNEIVTTRERFDKDIMKLGGEKIMSCSKEGRGVYLWDNIIPVESITYKNNLITPNFIIEVKDEEQKIRSLSTQCNPIELDDINLPPINLKPYKYKDKHYWLDDETRYVYDNQYNLFASKDILDARDYMFPNRKLIENVGFKHI